MTDLGQEQDQPPGGAGAPGISVAPVRKRRRVRRRFVLLFVVLAVLVVEVGIQPWVLHIGGRFTPTMTWSGYGQVQASNGGEYELYVHMRGGYFSGYRRAGCSHRGCNNVLGDAQLCGRNGVTEDFALTGVVHTWWSTDGASTMLLLTGGSPVKLPDGWAVAFGGTWQGASLVVKDTDNSFTEPFTPDGTIRTTTSTADAGTATVTLRSGSADDFSRACRALSGKH